MDLIKSVFNYVKENCTTHKLVKCDSFANIDSETSIHVYAVVQDKSAQNNPWGAKPPTHLLDQWNKIWKDAYGLTFTLKCIPFAVIFSLQREQKVIGVCGYNTYPNSKIAFFHSLAITEKGYARSFCQHAIDYAKDQENIDTLLIGVSAKANKWLFDFYQRMGAVPLSQNHKFDLNKCIEYRLSREPLKWMIMKKDQKLSI